MMSSTKVSWACFITLILGVAFGSGSGAWSSTLCSTKVSVSEFRRVGEITHIGTTAAEALEEVSPGWLPTHEFLVIFAQEIEAAVLDAVETEYCSRGFAVELDFYKFELITSQDIAEQSWKKLAELDYSYADVEVDETEKSVKVTIVWNPRRMLRDQLLFLGYEFDSNERIGPIDIDEITPLLRALKRLSETAFSRAELESKIPGLRGMAPDDMYGLAINSGGRYRGEFVLGSGVSVVEMSRRGYTAMTVLAIERALDGSGSPPLRSLADVESKSIRELYDWGPWGKGIKLED